MPGTCKMVSFAHTRSLAVMYNTSKLQPPIHNKEPQIFQWFPLTALYTLVQSIDSMSPPVYHNASIHSILCTLYTLLHVQALSIQNRSYSSLPSPIWFTPSCPIHLWQIFLFVPSYSDTHTHLVSLSSLIPSIHPNHLSKASSVVSNILLLPQFFFTTSFLTHQTS